MIVTSVVVAMSSCDCIYTSSKRAIQQPSYATHNTQFISNDVKNTAMSHPPALSCILVNHESLYSIHS